MALQAQFKTTTAGGSVAYLVRGTDTEIQDFCASKGEYLRIDEESGLPLHYQKVALPGPIDAWHPLVKIQGGPRSGQFTLNVQNLRFQEMQVESVKSGILQDKIATVIAQSNYVQQVKAASNNALSVLQTAVAQEEPEPQPMAVADPVADITDAVTGNAPKVKKPE